MQTITIGPKYFQGERRAYQSWQNATVREILQNSNDSKGCTRIEVSIAKYDNSDTIIVKDNGAGMSREILDNVFMVLGESTKGAGDTGGFGIARNLIVFSNKSYVIRSGNWIAKGIGANYEVTETADNFRGCQFEIETDKHDWLSEFRNVLELSRINPTVYLNGERFTSEPERARFVRDLTFGKVYVNKSAAKEKGNVLVCRINGLFMFSKYISAKARVFVEIEPSQSKEVLTSNRDGLQYTQQRELDAFLNELASETLTALKPKKELFNRIMNKGKGFKAIAKKEITKKEISLTVQTALNEFGQAVAAKMVTVGADYSLVENSDNQEGINESNLNLSYDMPDEDKVIRYSIIVNEESDFEAICKLYDPSILTSSSTRYKLLAVWQKMIQKLTEENAKIIGDHVWGIGFIFSRDTEAQYRKIDGVNYFLINPINEDQKMKYSINCPSSLGRMLACAMHEVAHTDLTMHDETYANRLTNLTKEVNANFKDILRYVKS